MRANSGFIAMATWRRFKPPTSSRPSISGFYGRIAIAYVEWGGELEQRIVIPWRLIDGRAGATAAAAVLAGPQGPPMHDTSISSALLFADLLFRNNGLASTRRVIDISGDGANNWGPPVTSARDAVVQDGTTINGLPVTLHPGGPGGMDPVLLTIYYEDCVVGGPDFFVLSVQSPRSLCGDDPAQDGAGNQPAGAHSGEGQTDEAGPAHQLRDRSQRAEHDLVKARRFPAPLAWR